MDAWRTWQAYLDHTLALDSLGSAYADLYERRRKGRKRDAFRIGYAAFLAQYRHALEFIELAEKNPQLHVVLNEQVPELGLPAGTYSRLKRGFLSVARGTEFARLSALYTLYEDTSDSALARGIEEDRKAVWRAGKGTGPLLTAKNAARVVRDMGFTAWFPVQKGVSQAMGDTKVWRSEKSLIAPRQIRRILHRLEPGDILLERREWYMSNVGLPGFWPHAALYIGTAEQRRAYFSDPEVLEWIRGIDPEREDLDDLLAARYPNASAEAARPREDGHAARVIEAVGEGVIFTSLEHSADADSLVVLRPRLPKWAKARALYRAFHYSGRPYDFNFDARTDAALVCTELVYKSYEADGTGVGLRLPLIEALGRPVTPANEIARMFDEQFGTEEQQLDFVLFLDGHERKRSAVFADVDGFRRSWRRPKWHILVQDTPLSDLAGD